MSFIKTNASIYDVDKLRVSDDLVGSPYVTQDGWCIYQGSVLTRADSIKKLCDKFVCVRKGKPPTIVDWSIAVTTHDTDKDAVIYGAIWSMGKNNEPRLKSVAIMNDDGELVLLRQ